jgi:hypothetical protein
MKKTEQQKPVLDKEEINLKQNIKKVSTYLVKLVAYLAIAYIMSNVLHSKLLLLIPELSLIKPWDLFLIIVSAKALIGGLTNEIDNIGKGK